jgi:hypothetical protein
MNVTKEWLEARQACDLTASEAGNAFGLGSVGRYTWFQQHHKLIPIKAPSKLALERMEKGREEEVFAAHVLEQSKLIAKHNGYDENTFYYASLSIRRSPDQKWVLGSTVDRSCYLMTKDGSKNVIPSYNVEIKTCQDENDDEEAELVDKFFWSGYAAAISQSVLQLYCTCAKKGYLFRYRKSNGAYQLYELHWNDDWSFLDTWLGEVLDKKQPPCKRLPGGTKQARIDFLEKHFSIKCIASSG